jgi:hypothetical protein
LAAWPSGESGPCGPRQRAQSTLAVARSPAAWWGLADGKVLEASTGGLLGWRRAGGVEVGLDERGGEAAASAQRWWPVSGK